MPRYKIKWKQTTEHSMVVEAKSTEEARGIYEDIYYDPNDYQDPDDAGDPPIYYHSIEIEDN
jgi:hypothetical protein